MTTVLLLAHPDFAASRANRALLAGLDDLPGLEVTELYARYPKGEIDLAAERARVLGDDDGRSAGELPAGPGRDDDR